MCAHSAIEKFSYIDRRFIFRAEFKAAPGFFVQVNGHQWVIFLQTSNYHKFAHNFEQCVNNLEVIQFSEAGLHHPHVTSRASDFALNSNAKLHVGGAIFSGLVGHIKCSEKRKYSVIRVQLYVIHAGMCI